MGRSSFFAALFLCATAVTSVTAQQLYWVDNRVGHAGVDARIHRAQLDGSEPEIVYELPFQFVRFTDIALDPENGKMYWSDTLGIRRANLDGSDVETVVETLFPTSLDLDIEAGHVYWSATGGLVPGDDPAEPMALADGIRRANLDGSSIVSVIDGQPCAGAAGFPACVARTVAIDAEDGSLYWTHSPTRCPPFPDFPCPADGEIRVANLDGSDERILVDGLSAPRGVALDLPLGKMYWSELDVIRRAELDGSIVEEIVTEGIFPSAALAVEPGGGKLYYPIQLGTPCIPKPDETCPDPVSVEIRRVDPEGADAETLFIGFAQGIALDLPDGGDCDDEDDDEQDDEGDDEDEDDDHPFV